jgi:hypothetical protein
MTDRIPSIRDDSHARAIVLGTLSFFRSNYLKEMDRLENQIQKINSLKSKIRIYNELCKAEENIISDFLLYKEIKKSRSKKRVITTFLTFGGVELFEEDFDEHKADRSYPFLVNRLDSRNLSNDGKTFIVALITEHALIKMVRRNQCHDSSMLINLLRIHVEPVIRMIMTNVSRLPDKFILLCGESYMPCEKSDGIPLIKSWISRSSWTPETEAKLSCLCDYFKTSNKVFIISDEEFNNKIYIDPTPYMKD